MNLGRKLISLLLLSLVFIGGAFAVSFTASDIDGNTVTDAIISESKLTMINVWATYCSPCIKEMPSLGQIANEYDKSEFQIIGVVSDIADNDARYIKYVKELVAATKADYMHLPSNMSLYDAFLKDVMVVPTTFFLNSEGEIIDTVYGSLSKKAWSDRIESLLKAL